MVQCVHRTVSEASAVCESLHWGSASLGSWHLSRSPAAPPPRSQHVTGAGSALRDVTGNVAVNLHSSQIKVYPSVLHLKLVKRRAEVYHALLLAKSTLNKILLPENPSGLSAAASHALPPYKTPVHREPALSAHSLLSSFTGTTVIISVTTDYIPQAMVFCLSAYSSPTHT